MNECKCGRIPPCYSGKKFRIHEELEKIKAWDKTHDKVYELNRQMCDISFDVGNVGCDYSVRQTVYVDENGCRHYQDCEIIKN